MYSSACFVFGVEALRHGSLKASHTSAFKKRLDSRKGIQPFYECLRVRWPQAIVLAGVVGLFLHHLLAVLDVNTLGQTVPVLLHSSSLQIVDTLLGGVHFGVG